MQTEGNNGIIFDNVIEAAKAIPDSNGSAYYEKAKIKIGIITDVFMYNYYKDAADFVPVGHDNYREIIDKENLQLLIYVSCWRGINGDDWYGDDRHDDVPKAIEYANQKGIVTIFQSIEDPTNYERYLPIAKVCGYIFTTDSDCVQQYKEDTGNENVFLLKYGVNPLFHNPIGINEKYNLQHLCPAATAFFAGSWMERYKNRCHDIRLLFNGVLSSSYNLLVADRNVEVKLPGYKFPKKYRPYLVPAIEHTTLQKVHKLFNYNININTVQDSPTMCAMRVYELQALGCLVLSNYALAVSECFPGLFMVQNQEEVKEILEGYEAEERYRMQVENLRGVMTDQTVFDRLNEIFARCGIAHRFPRKRVAVLCEEKTAAIERAFAAQTYAEKMLLTREEYDLSKEQIDFVAFFSEKHAYGENYLTDMMNAFKYCKVEFVTRGGSQRREEYAFTQYAESVYTSVMTKEKYEQVKDLHKIDLTGEGFRIDSFELDEAKRKSEGTKEIAVIVPVYNNGEYLYGRCFRSLLRSSVFDKMQIYLVDDGSDDENTVRAVKTLYERYDNVSAYFFEKGGSGSAARPRNKGVEISKEPYITYLDPDNEAIAGGYAKLYEKIRETDADMAFGAIYMRTSAEKYTRIGYFFKDTQVKDPRKVLLEENFRSQSIQACLIKRELITRHGLKNPEGAFGEDTLFFYDLMMYASEVYYLNLPIHVYYAQRANSSINDIGEKFFERSLILEKEQVARFKKYGIFDDYAKRKLDYFIIHWYIEKLNKAKPDERDACVRILDEIVKLYGKTIEDYESFIEREESCS